ncbi:MAG: glycosyltransferase family 2 protein [Candidatus Carbobacillus sp.]|nr:glycosyltransferase family 2 protein [Candidatus Carbobacillus sp.]
MFTWMLISIPLIYWAWMLIDAIRARHSLLCLQPITSIEQTQNHPFPVRTSYPSLSVIIAARNEALHIERTVKSLLRQSYRSFGDYEIIVVNDRSTDTTGQTLDQLKMWTSKNGYAEVLTVIHINDLPAGWLGKNHALWRGSQKARGEIILFSDADIDFHPDALLTAVRFMIDHHLDHLTLTPRLISRSYLTHLFGHYFMFAFSLFKRLWWVNQRSRAQDGIGVGAFNLLRSSVYRAIGTHQAFAMRPDDDLALGQRVKHHHFQQYLAIGKALLTVEWYESIAQASRGIEKNAFAGMGYHALLAIIALIGQLWFFLFPYFALFLNIPLSYKLIWSIIIVLMLTLYAYLTQRLSHLQWHELLTFPLAALLFNAIFFRALVLTWLRGGIQWRGTFYPLKELKRHMNRAQNENR